MDSQQAIRVVDSPHWPGRVPFLEKGLADPSGTSAGAFEPQEAAEAAVPATRLSPEAIMAEAIGAAGKRTLDLGVAAVLLILLLPVMLLVALLVKLDSSGPVFFRQRRLGRDMRPFTVLKFRTMATDATPELHSRYIAAAARGDHGEATELKKLTHDPRVTRLGRTLRKLSIDELPQLCNVLAGHMALVGPRPALDYEVEYYEPHHFARFAVRPGITGLWQVSGRSRVGFREMLDLDAEYAATATFGTDVKILARTPRAAVSDSA